MKLNSLRQYVFIPPPEWSDPLFLLRFANLIKELGATPAEVDFVMRVRERERDLHWRYRKDRNTVEPQNVAASAISLIDSPSVYRLSLHAASNFFQLCYRDEANALFCRLRHESTVGWFIDVISSQPPAEIKDAWREVPISDRITFP